MRAVFGISESYTFLCVAGLVLNLSDDTRCVFPW